MKDQMLIFFESFFIITCYILEIALV